MVALLNYVEKRRCTIAGITVHHNITFYGLEYFQYVKCRTNRKLSNDKDMVETDIEEVEPGAVF